MTVLRCYTYVEKNRRDVYEEHRGLLENNDAIGERVSR